MIATITPAIVTTIENAAIIGAIVAFVLAVSAARAASTAASLAYRALRMWNTLSAHTRKAISAGNKCVEIFCFDR